MVKVIASLLGVAAIDNGLFFDSPPMGWRSWNAYHAAVNQSLMEKVMDQITAPVVGGKSIADLGFKDVGLDDYWQQCGAGEKKSFHDANGKPIVDPKKFHDMKGMVDHGHSKGLTVGWYGNNCGCSEHEFKNNASFLDKMYHGDVDVTVDFGFDGIKLDGCGEMRDLDKYSAYFNASGRKVSIENCHWGGTVPSFDKQGNLHCPWNFFRTSGDINPSWGSMIGNLLTTTKFQDLEKPIAQRGCWAYPDMLEVGNMATFEEDRAHFGAWIITSTPLILGYDVLDVAKTKAVWPIISNEKAIKVNQEWAGHPGFLLRKVEHAFALPFTDDFSLIWLKPQKVGFAMLLINSGSKSIDLTVDFTDVKWQSNAISATAPVVVENLWDGTASEATGKLTATVGAHDSAFFLLKNKDLETLFA